MSNQPDLAIAEENLESFDLLENNNQAPINPNIMKIEEKPNKVSISDVICSETESTNRSCEIKNGLTACMYLNDGGVIFRLRTIPVINAASTPNTIMEFLILLEILLKF